MSESENRLYFAPETGGQSSPSPNITIYPSPAHLELPVIFTEDGAHLLGLAFGGSSRTFRNPDGTYDHVITSTRSDGWPEEIDS